MNGAAMSDLRRLWCYLRGWHRGDYNDLGIAACSTCGVLVDPA